MAMASGLRWKEGFAARRSRPRGAGVTARAFREREIVSPADLPGDREPREPPGRPRSPRTSRETASPAGWLADGPRRAQTVLALPEPDRPGSPGPRRGSCTDVGALRNCARRGPRRLRPRVTRDLPCTRSMTSGATGRKPRPRVTRGLPCTRSTTFGATGRKPRDENSRNQVPGTNGSGVARSRRGCGSRGWDDRARFLPGTAALRCRCPRGESSRGRRCSPAS